MRRRSQVLSFVPGIAFVGACVASSLASTHDTWDSKIESILTASTHRDVVPIFVPPPHALDVGDSSFRRDASPSVPPPPIELPMPPRQINGLDTGVRFVVPALARPDVDCDRPRVKQRAGSRRLYDEICHAPHFEPRPPHVKSQ